MNCQDVRERSVAPLRGGISVTDRALVHAHVVRCADCQAERAALQLVASSRPPVKPSRGPVTAAARLITRVSPSLIRLRSSLPRSLHGAACTAREAIGGEVTRALGLLSRRRVRVSSALIVGRRAAVRAIELAWASAARVAWRLSTLGVPTARAAADMIGRARVARARVPRLPMTAGRDAARAVSEAVAPVLGPLARSLGEVARAAGRVSVAVAMIPDRARAHPRVCAGIVSLLVLVPSTLFLALPFGPGDQPSQDARPPVGRRAAEPVAPAPLVPAAPSRPASGSSQVAPTPRLAAPEPHAAIPAPVRRAIVSAPAPSAEVTPGTEASDPAAAIDWLLRGNGPRDARWP